MKLTETVKCPAIQRDTEFYDALSSWFKYLIGINMCRPSAFVILLASLSP